MRVAGWCIGGLLFAVVSGFADDFDDALAAYDAGKFADAKRGFERVIAGGASANAFYNLGNARFRLGELGGAAIAYERALMVDPAFGEAASNLKLVREKARGRIAEPDWRERAMAAIPAKAAPWIAVVIAWAGWFLAGTGALRRRAGSIIFGALLGAAGGVIYSGAVWIDGRQSRLAVVVGAESEARTQPADRAPLAEALPPASRLHVVSEQGEWIFCELPGGGQGWVKAGQIERVRPPRKP